MKYPFFYKVGNEKDGLHYRFVIWRFYIWFSDYRKSNKDYMPKKFGVNCWGFIRKRLSK